MSAIEAAGRDLTTLEGIIERGMTTFVDVGTALAEIRDRRLYRETHPEFDSYCRERWGFNRQRAHQMIEAASVTVALSTTVDIPPPRIERQARELAKVEPEHRADTWRAVVDEHGPEATAETVRDVARDQQIRRQLSYPKPQPANLTAMPTLAERLPEATVDALADEFYRAQLPSMVNQVVSLAAQHIRRAAIAAQKELARINWGDVTDDMRESQSVTDSLHFMDAELGRFADAMQHARPANAALRRVK